MIGCAAAPLPFLARWQGGCRQDGECGAVEVVLSALLCCHPRSESLLGSNALLGWLACKGLRGYGVQRMGDGVAYNRHSCGLVDAARSWGEARLGVCWACWAALPLPGGAAVGAGGTEVLKCCVSVFWWSTLGCTRVLLLWCFLSGKPCQDKMCSFHKEPYLVVVPGDN